MTPFAQVVMLSRLNEDKTMTFASGREYQAWLAKRNQ